MNNEFKPRFYAIKLDQLTDFVRNIAIAGDIAIAYSHETKTRYVYFCTDKNIGKDINPHWNVLIGEYES